MTWNIWHGGREDGESVGPKRVVEVMKQSRADLIAMQETYGSGELISQALGFNFLLRATNVSIHSRFPILEDISVHEPFKCVGAIVELPNRSKLAFYSIWLPYSGEIWEEGTRKNDLVSLLAACKSSEPDLRAIRDGIEARLSKYPGIPVIIAGDFNSMSNLDYSAVAIDQYKVIVDWPTSNVLPESGYRDSYREVNPVVNRQKDRTWTPRFPKQEQDRIDFIYYRGGELSPMASEVIDTLEEGFPSDHAAVVTRFEFNHLVKKPRELTMRVASYNIRHCAGMDDVLNPFRTLKAIRKLDADIIGLQEVDHSVNRSGKMNQPHWLGEQLNMHAAFGDFMPYDGGHYGMAILSRYPIRKVTPFRLPEGNEPRIALIAEVNLPNDENILVVNVHFDWVDDDKFRFAQASALTEFLKSQPLPFILLGDFNDGPESRTLALFRSIAKEADKPHDNSFTFSAAQPEKEIDFLFAAPANRWDLGSTQVVDERIASDHRPIIANFKLRTSK
ncbi:MAG TPA: endonuclease/exonuclease/phosphatase family protein [Fimbriimonadaceae bacterium]|nr:endonuclease/exonuclease/phosphatase family protein [Fimbriimonadaceae bacterium]